jgi:hypothetical protein
MSLNITKEVAALEQMTVGELHDRYVEVFGEAVRSRHRRYLIRRFTVSRSRKRTRWCGWRFRRFLNNR